MESDGVLRMLTVQQPHAWAIVAGHKDVENRTWPFPLPLGTTIAIHAGLKHDKHGLRVSVDLPDYFVRGAVVGFVDVLDSHDADACWRSKWSGCSKWAGPSGFHWRLGNAWMLDEPVPARGRLWLHRVEDDARDALDEALRARGEISS